MKEKMKKSEGVQIEPLETVTDPTIPAPVADESGKALESDMNSEVAQSSNMEFRNFKSIILVIRLLAVICILFAGMFFLFKYYIDSGQSIAELQNKGLESQIGMLANQLKSLNDEQAKTSLSIQEQANRQVVREKSQDEMLTAAVSKVGPAVVSIVISKDVPQLEVVYQNPFGNDPYFKDFGFQIPVYQQKGVKREKVGAGTGFLITTDGYILTNKHVVYDTTATYTALLSDGRQEDAKVAYLDQKNDIAILKIEGKYSAASLGSSSSLQLGQTIIAIGNALGEYNNSVSVGIVSGLNRTIQASGSSGTEQLTGVIQTDAAVNPGNSGGPLLDLSGKVVGVNVATVIGSNSISFSIPINEVKTIIKSAINR
jgi:S1-C subfamily serine protease